MRRLFWKVALALMRFNARPKKGIVVFAFFVILAGISFATGVFAETPVTDSGPDPADWVVSQLAKIITYIASGVGQLIVLLIGVAVIPIMQYNGFASSPVIGLGWAVVRDAVNMFFVIVLIVIAFGTIFGHKRFQWQQQVPRLLIMAIVINFSRTLCGLLIDFSQVVMFTFVNALKDIAGGNFIQMFGLGDILQADEASSLFQGEAGGNAGATGPQPFDLLIAAIVALMMMMIVFVAMIFLTIILAYRIVILWVLVTIAPLAWFFKGAEGVVAVKKNPYAVWWARFSCALQLGPVLTFFLWLALSVAGSGDISTVEEFGTSSAPPGEGLQTGSLLKAMDTSRMTSFIIGILLLFSGFDAAKEACDGADGVMSGMMQKAKGASTAIAKAPIGAAALAGMYAGRGALRGGRAVGGALYKQTAGRALSAGRDLVADSLSQFGKEGPRIPVVGGYLKRSATEAAAGMKAKKAAEADASVKDKRPLTKDSMISYLNEGVPLGADGRKEYMARLRQALASDEVRTELGADGVKKILGTRDPITGKSAQELLEKTYEGDATFGKQMKDIQKKAPSAFGQKALDLWVKDASDIQNVDKSEHSSEAFRNHVKNLQYRYTDAQGNKQEMAMDLAIQEGRLGNRARDYWEQGGKDLASTTSVDALKTKPASAIDVATLRGDNYSPEVAVKLLQDGNEGQLRALAAKSEIRDMIRADLNRVKADGLTTDDQKKRVAFRQNLAKLGFSVDESFDLKRNAAGDLDDIATSEDDMSDFKAAVDADPSLALKSVANPKSNLAKTAAGALSPKTLQKMLREYQNKLANPDAKPEDKRKAGEELKKVFEAAEARQDEIMDIGDGKVPGGLKSEHGRLGKILKQRQHFDRSEATFELGEQELGDIGAEMRVGDRAKARVYTGVGEGKDRGAIVGDLQRELADLRRQSAAQAVVLANAQQTANAALETSARAEIEKLKRQVQETQDIVTTVVRMADDEFRPL